VSIAPVHSVLALWPGAPAVQARVGHDSVVQVWDSVTGRLIDSVVVRSPLPDPLVPVVQWIFQKPGWLMISVLVLGAIVALANASTGDAVAVARELARAGDLRIVDIAYPRKHLFIDAYWSLAANSGRGRVWFRELLARAVKELP